ncbi:ATP-dependent DNA helicase [Caerostris extrusa]|uniref:ATP-dependent DNA helicase n=1 Tax=Caerostris extrusa TaxID=172846 RepID=A0AAV4TAI8_CAEEX|nr:ATP-dependent DNA helicase [Caerostris extrusa]
MSILKEWQVSSCECIFRLGHLNLRESSRKGVFLNTRKPVTRNRMIKFNEVGQAEGFTANIFERYKIRPLGEAHGYNFNTMNLRTFAMLFEPHYPRRRKTVNTILMKTLTKNSQQEREEN